MENLNRIYKLENGRELKKKLKEKFDFSFECRKSHGSGRYYHVYWTDGPSYNAVDKFCASFDDTSKDDITTDLFIGSQYILLQRSISKEARLSAISYIQKQFGFEMEYAENEPGGFNLIDRNWEDKRFIEHHFNTMLSNASFEN